MTKELGKHDFSGHWLSYRGRSVIGNVSAGCFQWLPRKNGYEGIKKGKVKVRVSGPIHMADQIRAKAAEICAQLDDGTYTGPKNVRVC